MRTSAAKLFEVPSVVKRITPAWKYPESVHAGMQLPEPDTEKSAIVRHVRRVRVPTQLVYDLTVAVDHEFFANGLLVHNCGWMETDTESPDRMDALTNGYNEIRKLIGVSVSLAAPAAGHTPTANPEQNITPVSDPRIRSSARPSGPRRVMRRTSL